MKVSQEQYEQLLYGESLVIIDKKIKLGKIIKICFPGFGSLTAICKQYYGHSDRFNSVLKLVK